MRILILAEWDFADCGYFLSQAINRHTGNFARSVRLHPSVLDFPHDIQAPSDDELRDLWDWADVIHIHDDYRNLPPDLPDKPTVVTYHGSLYRADPGEYNARDAGRGWLQTVATLDLEMFGPRWLPDTRPSLARYIDRSPTFKVCHAPTKRKLKGTDFVIRACRRTFGFDLIENVSWEETLTRKGKCWLTIDQFRLGYGCNAIEAWMMGQPVVAGAPKEILDKIARTAGYLPFVHVDEAAAPIRAMIERLRDDGAFYAEAQRLGSTYVSRFHSMPVVANKALEFYREAMETFRSRDIVYAYYDISPASSANTEIGVEYIGDSTGSVQFDVNGHIYRFSRLQSVKRVARADADRLLTMRDRPRRQRGKQRPMPGGLLFRRIK
jgi:hypothetical protein